jgi:hypothetical protein
MPPLLGGLSYAHAAMSIYLHFGCVLVGIEEMDPLGEYGTRVVVSTGLVWW